MFVAYDISSVSALPAEYEDLGQGCTNDRLEDDLLDDELAFLLEVLVDLDDTWIFELDCSNLDFLNVLNALWALEEGKLAVLVALDGRLSVEAFMALEEGRLSVEFFRDLEEGRISKML